MGGLEAVAATVTTPLVQPGGVEEETQVPVAGSRYPLVHTVHVCDPVALQISQCVSGPESTNHLKTTEAKYERHKQRPQTGAVDAVASVMTYWPEVQVGSDTEHVPVVVR